MSDIGSVYADALSALVDKIRADTCIVAAVLVGSLAYDTVWERSDIDLLLITEEMKASDESACLAENGVNIHCCLMTRSGFRKLLEGATQGSFIHSLIGKGHMLFSRDEALAELFASRNALGERDRATQVLRVASGLLPGLTKAEKWFHAKQDFDYCYLWIMKCIDPLAAIEMLLHGEVPSREVIQRALVLNPALFCQIYTDLIHCDPSPAALESALTAINACLRERVHDLFGLILDHLREEGEVRSISDISHFFGRTYNIENVDSACEWLADEGFIEKMATPARLTTKSRISVEETAYYFGTESGSCR